MVFDHPTHVDEEGTLGRTLESMKILEQKDFKLVIIVCPTAPDVEEEAVKQVKRIISNVKLDIETYLLTPKDLRNISDLLEIAGATEEMRNLISLKGYASVRNVCIMTGAILSSDAVILIDDDEVFEKPDFVERSVEFLGKRVYGDVVHGIAGYYLNKMDQYYDDVTMEPWMTYWDRFGTKARAFDNIIGCEPRIKRTPFAFGGAMVLGQDLYECVPFDPRITRGEDIDYLINSKMYGFTFFLDNTLSIKHLPVPKKHPQWKRIREDIYRFVYEKAKITSQYDTKNMVKISAKDFDPYPGEFLKDDLEEKIFNSNMMLAMDYISNGDKEAAQEAMRNIHLAKHDAPPDYDAFSAYRTVQRNWENLIKLVKKNRYAVRKIMEKGNLSQDPILIDEEHFRKLTTEEIYTIMRKSQLFETLTDEELEALVNVASVKTFYENEAIFRMGSMIQEINVILKGNVVLCYNDAKNEADAEEVARLKKGSTMGEGFLSHNTYSLTALATEFTELICIRREDVERMMQENPALGVKLLKILLYSSANKLNNANTKNRTPRKYSESVSESDIRE